MLPWISSDQSAPHCTHNPAFLRPAPAYGEKYDAHIHKGRPILGAVFLSDDGSTRAVEAAPDVLAALMPAYALTIHKAQGSQWRDVALVVGRSRLLDRSLLYTAATRAANSLLVVGPRQAIVSAISTPPKVSGLRTTLLHRIGSLS